MSFSAVSYKLRSAGPVPTGDGNFLTQTFMAEKSLITIHEATTQLLKSDNMAGLGGDYVSASYTRLPYLLNGSQVFSGNEVKKPIYIDEGSMPGGSI